MNSGRRVTHNNWTAIPIPNEVIQEIHRLAAACIKHKGIVFTDKNGNIIDDNSPDENEEYSKPDITGVSTQVGKTGTGSTGTGSTLPDNNALELQTTVH